MTLDSVIAKIKEHAKEKLQLELLIMEEQSLPELIKILTKAYSPLSFKAKEIQ